MTMLKNNRTACEEIRCANLEAVSTFRSCSCVRNDRHGLLATRLPLRFRNFSSFPPFPFPCLGAAFWSPFQTPPHCRYWTSISQSGGPWPGIRCNPFDPSSASTLLRACAPGLRKRELPSLHFLPQAQNLMPFASQGRLLASRFYSPPSNRPCRSFRRSPYHSLRTLVFRFRICSP